MQVCHGETSTPAIQTNSSSNKRAKETTGESVKECVLNRMFPEVMKLNDYIATVSRNRIRLTVSADPADYVSYIDSVYILPEKSPVEIDVRLVLPIHMRVVF